MTGDWLVRVQCLSDLLEMQLLNTSKGQDAGLGEIQRGLSTEGKEKYEVGVIPKAVETGLVRNTIPTTLSPSGKTCQEKISLL